MRFVLAHRNSVDVFSTADVRTMIRNLRTVRDTAGRNGPGAVRDLAVGTCERLLRGGLVSEVSMDKSRSGPHTRRFRKRTWEDVSADKERTSLCRILKVGESTFEGTVVHSA